MMNYFFIFTFSLTLLAKSIDAQESLPPSINDKIEVIKKSQSREVQVGGRTVFYSDKLMSISIHTNPPTSRGLNTTSPNAAQSHLYQVVGKNGDFNFYIVEDSAPPTSEAKRNLSGLTNLAPAGAFIDPNGNRLGALSGRLKIRLRNSIDLHEVLKNYRLRHDSTIASLDQLIYVSPTADSAIDLYFKLKLDHRIKWVELESAQNKRRIN